MLPLLVQRLRRLAHRLPSTFAAGLVIGGQGNLLPGDITSQRRISVQRRDLAIPSEVEISLEPQHRHQLTTPFFCHVIEPARAIDHPPANDTPLQSALSTEIPEVENAVKRIERSVGQRLSHTRIGDHTHAHAARSA